MNCLEYRQICGAEPNHRDAAFAEHEAQCSGCRAYANELRELDGRIRKALMIELPGQTEAAQEQTMAPARRSWQPARLGLAASFLAAVGLGVGVWLSAPPPALAEAVTGHLSHERHAWQTTDNPVARDVLDAVLKDGDIEVRQNFGLISYARTCNIRGHDVPHLMIQGERGPVMLLIMREEKIDQAIPLRADGYEGLILPVGDGSIAVVGREGEALEPLTEQITQSVDWSF